MITFKNLSGYFALHIIQPTSYYKCTIIRFIHFPVCIDILYPTTNLFKSNYISEFYQ